MKTNITLLIAFLFLGLNTGFAQGNEECNINLSLFTERVKAKDFEGAYQYYQKGIKDCPKYNPSALYKYGEDMFKGLLKASSEDKKVQYINELIECWDLRAVNYAKKTPKGKFDAKKAELRYDNRVLLGLTDEQIYNEFDAIYKSDLDNFKSPKGLYVYFKMMVSLYDKGQKTPQELFNKYDDVVDKIETEVGKNSVKLNQLIAKGDDALTKKDKKYKKFYTQTLAAFGKISGSLETELGDRANCSVLIPIYQRDYEQNKNNGVWLQRAMNKLYAKGCKADPMFVKIVKQKNSLEPNADTAWYLYVITGEQQYFDQSLSLQTDPLKKAALYNKIAREYKSKGSYGKAREFYNKVLNANPANTNPHLQIAAMYAASVKNCGNTNFEKRSIFWLAANEAAKASSAIAAKYRALAPSKQDIFTSGMSGKTIKIGCWIGRSVTVPKI